jgi:hypothetical protein
MSKNVKVWKPNSTLFVLYDLLAELEGQVELSSLWSEDAFQQGYNEALEEVQGLIRERIQIERLGE